VRKLYVAVACLAFSLTCLAAQQGQEREVRGARATSAELSPALKSVAFLEGRWRVEQAMQPQYSDKSKSASGVMTIERDLNGNALIGRFEATRTEQRLGEFEGHLVLAAAKTDQRAQAGAPGQSMGLSLFWVDSQGNASLTQNVTLADNKLTAIVDKPHGGMAQGEKIQQARVTFTKVSDDKMEFSMEAQTQRGWEKVATASYTRMQEQATPTAVDMPPAQQRQ